MSARIATALLMLAAIAAMPFALGAAEPAAGASYEVSSPNNIVKLRVNTGKKITFDLLVSDRPVMTKSTMSLNVAGQILGISPVVKSTSTRSHSGVVKPVVRQKSAEFNDDYNELRLVLEGGHAIVFRAYNEGAAYRWETAFAQEEVIVQSEEMTLKFGGKHPVWFPEEDSFFSHMERQYQQRALGDLAAKNFASLPAVVDAGFVKVAVAEADLEDYPGLWLTGAKGNALAATFAKYPLKEKLNRDRNLHVTQEADYIAKTKGTRAFPWRVLGIARRDGDLITNPLVYLLASPSRIADTSWIKPGKVAWDWWNANNLRGVDFTAGIDTRTYKYYIDFASKNGLDYIILDEGWYKLGDVLDIAPGMDVPELIAYGRERGVGIILWVVAKSLDDKLIPALDQFEKWGVRGIKVDFMQRADQPMIAFYERVCREAAKRKLLVDFHGAQQPALMTRTWPNIISVEGVRGLEWNKWSSLITPAHDATLPFTRMFLGPMDYTPGAVHNANLDAHAIIYNRPMSQGTRCHQLGLYVIFESPLQMLADTPTEYEREPVMMEFLRAVPSTWDETRVLDARIGSHVLIARRHGDEWYLGAITDWNKRELEAALSFLPAGEYRMVEYADGPNAARHAEDFTRAERTVTSATKLDIRLAPGGGWAARLTPVSKK